MQPVLFSLVTMKYNSYFIFIEGDVPDEPQPVKKEEKRNFRTPITTLNMKSDPISTILDKIDAEISALSRSQSVRYNCLVYSFSPLQCLETSQILYYTCQFKKNSI